ncbi:MAG: 3-phosphoshikimate 1-carboxyvinyltransferase, partial [Saprospiraceae bacterium]|nr:3-phosphoshikimate 1-carboxyvinyltransferase [Saprospiraceae bacterium]
MIFSIHKPKPALRGKISLSGSKSISNRVLIIRALCEEPFDIEGLATAKDTHTLQKLLDHPQGTLDAGAAGTTYRFMTAYLAFQPGTQVLTGSERMKQRPIGILVDCLRQLGARIDYLEKEHYPPLRIGEPGGEKTVQNSEIAISAGTSSQYISALLLIAPRLTGGLSLKLKGEVVSRPYIEMTLQLMANFGIDYRWEGDTITVPRQAYLARHFRVEADWSAASYYYAMAALSKDPDLTLSGLFPNSLQGDAVLADMMVNFGVRTEFLESEIRLTRDEEVKPALFEWNFLKCPDLAQTLAVLCGGLGVQGLFTGLETLKIKETDRIEALKTELKKVSVYMSAVPQRLACNTDRQYYLIEGKAK